MMMRRCRRSPAMVLGVLKSNVLMSKEILTQTRDAQAATANKKGQNQLYIRLAESFDPLKLGTF